MVSSLIRRINNWLAKHLVGACLTCLAFSLFLDAYYVMRYIGGSFGGIDYFFCAIGAVGTIFYLIVTLLKIRRKMFEGSIKMIFDEAEKYYFHGFKLHRYIDTFAFWRLKNWLGISWCYELSILAMVMLRHNKTAILRRGNRYDKDGNFRTRHSWVEFKIPLNGWWVADFAWMNTGFCPKKDFLKAVHADGSKLEVKWSYTYSEFWSTPFVGAIREAMQNQKTSYILRKLPVFGSAAAKEYGFTEYCYSEEMLQHATGEWMIPYYDSHTKKPVSSRIIRDFVKNPKRQQPKTRSIRLARSAIHRYEKWKAEQEQPTASN